MRSKFYTDVEKSEILRDTCLSKRIIEEHSFSIFHTYVMLSWISTCKKNFAVEMSRSISFELLSGQVELIYSDGHNSKEIKRNIWTMKYSL